MEKPTNNQKKNKFKKKKPRKQYVYDERREFFSRYNKMRQRIARKKYDRIIGEFFTCDFCERNSTEGYIFGSKDKVRLCISCKNRLKSSGGIHIIYTPMRG